MKHCKKKKKSLTSRHKRRLLFYFVHQQITICWSEQHISYKWSEQHILYQSQFEVSRVCLVIWIPDTSFSLLMHSVIQSCTQDLVDFDACTLKKHSCCSGDSDAGIDQEASSYCAGTCLCTIINGEERGVQGPDMRVRLTPGSLESTKATNGLWHTNMCSAWPTHLINTHRKTTYSTKTPDYWVKQNMFLV